jgi:hypothetical protein
MVEDGKLNLTLRNMVNYRQFRAELDGKEIKGEAMELFEKFERGSGIVLKNAFKHVEALQTIDMFLLIEYISGVFVRTSKEPRPSKPFGQMQAALVIHYLSSISKMLDRVGESKVLGALAERNTLGLLVSHMADYHKFLDPIDIELGVKALSVYVGSEDFITHKMDHMQGSDVKVLPMNYYRIPSLFVHVHSLSHLVPCLLCITTLSLLPTPNCNITR